MLESERQDYEAHMLSVVRKLNPERLDFLFRGALELFEVRDFAVVYIRMSH